MWIVAVFLLAYLALMVWLVIVDTWVFIVPLVFALIPFFAFWMHKLKMKRMLLATWMARILFIIWVFFNCPLREWPKWRKHHRGILRRQCIPDCTVIAETRGKSGDTRKEKEIIHEVVEYTSMTFGIPQELLRQSDRFGHELYLPHYLQSNAEGEIFGLIDDLFEEHDIQSRLEEFPGPLRGMSLKQVIDWISTVLSDENDV